MATDALHTETTPRRPEPVAWQDLAWLAVVFVAGLLARAPFLTMPMIADEGGYAYATRGWLNGTGELYADLWISRPQGIFIVYALIFETLGTGTVAIRLAAWASACGVAVAVWMIARTWRARPVPIVAAMLSIVISATPSLEGYTANAEMFMMLPASWAVWTLIKSVESRWAAHWVYLSGVLVGVATMLKPSGIVIVALAAIMLVVTTRSTQEASWRMPAFWLGTGIATIGVPALVHGWAIGWGDFLYATVTYRLTMQSSATVPLTDHLVSLLWLILNALPILVMIALVVGITHRRRLGRPRWPARLAARRPAPARFVPSIRHAASWLGSPALERRLTVPNDRVGMVLRLWLLASFVGIAMGGDWWSHYFIQVIAPFSIWFAAALVDAARSVRHRLGVAIGAGAVVVLLAPWWVVLLGSADAMSNQLLAHPGYGAQHEVATWLRENSEPGTPIFVAFDQAAIYYLADRPPAYRHLYDQELRALPESYSEIISIIRSPERPLYIVSTRQPGPYPDDSRTFWQEVGQHYELETMIDGIPIYRAREYTPPAP